MSTFGHSALKIRRTSALTFGVLMALGARAYAADDPTTGASGIPAATEQRTEVEEIVVTGYRFSLEAALDVKRQAAGVVDAIKAEDIADFPDANLAESIQRIPGIAIARDAGEGRQISVRGLGPNFTRIRINGMEALTTTGGADASGGVNRSRSFDFNIFASELFNSITVRKTASAELEEGSLGATVDLETARPFDFDRFTFAVSSQIGYNDLAENVDPRAALLISNTFADGKFGALLSAAYTKRDGLEEGHSTVRWSAAGANGGFNAASNLPGVDASELGVSDGTGIYHPRIPRYATYEHDQERLGLTGSLQFQPAAGTLITVDALYADYDAERFENYLEAISFSRSGARGKSETVILDGVVDANNNLVYGVFDNVDMRVESRFDILETRFTQLTAAIDHEFSDTFSIRGMVGQAESKFDNPVQTTITLDRANSDGFSWDYRGDDREPEISWGFDPADPASWQFGSFGGQSDIRIRPQSADNTFQTAKLHGQLAFSDSFSLLAGVDWRRYEYQGRERRRAVAETNTPTLTTDQIAQLVTVVGASDNTPAYVVPNFNAFVDALDIYCNCGIYELTDIENSNARGSWQDIEETEPGAFVQANFSFDWGIPVRGNLGVRYVETQLDSVGYGVVNDEPEQIRAEHEYSNTLPSLNLAFELTDDFLLRFAAARVISRPGLGDLNPGGELTIQASNRVFDANNPFLGPTEADAYDLSAEWYFAEGSLLGLAAFYKDIGSFNSTVVTQVPYTALGLPLEFLEGTGVEPDFIFDYQRPVNGDGGELHGIEVNYQHQFSNLPAPWNGFGVLANYTYVESEIEYPTGDDGTVEGPLTGLSENSANATLYYENEVFGIRGSVAYRDEYATRIPGREATDLEGTNSTLNFDLAASYNLTRNVRLTFEALNLTDEHNDQFISSADRVVVYQRTGRQFFLGARFTY